MRIEEGIKVDFDDVMIKPQRSEQLTRNMPVNREFTVNDKNISGLPIISANMDTTGSMSMATKLSELGAFGCLHKHYPEEKLVDFFMNYNTGHKRIFYSLGIRDEDIQKLFNVQAKTTNAIQNICVDVANGYTESFVEKVKSIRDNFPDTILMAGNVVTPEMCQELIIQAGVDIVKVGIGPGSVCKTRKVTGVGYPQLSEIIECADAAHGLGALICADGGCDETNKINKAFGGGADFVMLGGMFAGCDECDGEWKYEYRCQSYLSNWQPFRVNEKDETRKVSLKFHGMSSKEAMEIHNGGMAKYRTSEGIEIVVPYKGPVEDTLDEIAGALRSAMSYVGARKLKEFSKRCTFVRIK